MHTRSALYASWYAYVLCTKVVLKYSSYGFTSYTRTNMVVYARIEVRPRDRNVGVRVRDNARHRTQTVVDPTQCDAIGSTRDAVYGLGTPRADQEGSWFWSVASPCEIRQRSTLWINSANSQSAPRVFSVILVES